jgi:diaminopimelate epimerase
MNIDFWKMHGAANDFIMVDDRLGTFPITDQKWIASVSSRRTGVGCEGVILIQKSETSDFRMRFFNPDGTEVEMCGNGARCVARLATDIGAAPAEMTIDTVAGQLKATVSETSVVLGLTPPIDWALDVPLTIDGSERTCSSVNTGVPHAVLIVDDLEATDVKTLGAAIRYHDNFAPAGTNANFVQVRGPNTIDIRTYERGVEDETLACGTGISAAALITTKAGLTSAPVTVIPASGDSLTVNFTLTEDGADDVTLEGPAVYVFQGSLKYEG